MPTLGSMDSFDSDGLFWLPASPDAKVAGHLRLLPDEMISELSLIGNIDNLFSGMTDGVEGGRRVLGIAGNQYLTLEDCFETSHEWDSTGLVHQRLHIGCLLTGAQIEDGQRLEFEAITLATDQLAPWVGRSGISTTMEEDPTSHTVYRLELRYDRLESELVAIPDGILTLGFEFGLRSNAYADSTITEACYLRVATSSMTHLDDLLFYSDAIQHLLTIATGTPARVESIHLWHPDVARELPSGRRVPEPIGYLAQPVDKVPRTRRRTPGEMLFTFDQLGGLGGVAAWLARANQYRPVLGSLLSSRYMTKMYIEDRFVNAAYAAESFHRLRFANQVRPRADFKQFKRELIDAVPAERQKWLQDQLQYSNEPRLLHRLEEMADYAGTVFTELVGDVNDWCKLTKDCRNSLVHYDERNATRPSPERLYYLSESLFYLTVLCLLRECGVKDDVLSGIARNNHFRWLRENAHHQ